MTTAARARTRTRTRIRPKRRAARPKADPYGLAQRTAPVQFHRARRRHDVVTSQRERIQAAFLASQNRLPDGRIVFGPEPQDITEEHADMWRTLALELMDLARREKARWRAQDERAGKLLNRAEMLMEDVEESMARAEHALHQFRNGPASLVEQRLHEILTATEAVQIAICDSQGLLALAGYEPGSAGSVRVRDMLEARAGDVQEIDSLRSAVSRANDRAEAAETRLLAFEVPRERGASRRSR